MISMNVRISDSLKTKLSKQYNNTRIINLVDGVGEKALENVQEYGYGSAGGATPSGGAPVWQGKVTVNGHYAGYLSDSHYIKKISPYHIQILSSADFTESLMEGISTNWFDRNGPIRFPPNYYHKRAVDKLSRDDSISIIWNNISNGV